MSGTHIRYTGCDGSSVEILHDGRVIADMAIEHVCALDSDLADCAAQAMQRKGEPILVPSHSKARGLQARNYGAYGVRL